MADMDGQARGRAAARHLQSATVHKGFWRTHFSPKKFGLLSRHKEKKDGQDHFFKFEPAQSGKK